MNTLGLYGRYVSASVRSQMEYRLSFLLQSSAQLLLTGAEFGALWMLFQRFGRIGTWTLPEVALFYGLVNVAFAVADSGSRGFEQFGALVKSGEFDRLLLRPRSTVLQIVGQELTLRRGGRLAQGALVLGWAMCALPVRWDAARLGLVALCVGGGACLFYGLLIVQATLAFWTTEPLEMMNVLTYGGVEAAQYPLTLYRPWFRRFFTFVVPLACLNYFPVHALLDRVDPLGSPRWLQWCSPLVGVLFLRLTLALWELGVRRYHSTGS